MIIQKTPKDFEVSFKFNEPIKHLPPELKELQEIRQYMRKAPELPNPKEPTEEPVSFRDSLLSEARPVTLSHLSHVKKPFKDFSQRAKMGIIPQVKRRNPQID